MNTPTPDDHLPKNPGLPPLSENALMGLAAQNTAEELADILRAYNGLPAANDQGRRQGVDWDAVFWCVFWVCIAAVLIFRR